MSTLNFSGKKGPALVRSARPLEGWRTKRKGGEETFFLVRQDDKQIASTSQAACLVSSKYVIHLLTPGNLISESWMVRSGNLPSGFS